MVLDSGGYGLKLSARKSKTSIRDIGECPLIERIRKVVDRPDPRVYLGIGDDAAVIDIATDQFLLITTDALVEKIHFKLDYFTFHQIGWRSMAANLSDIAAMAGIARHAVVSIAARGVLPVRAVEELYRGMDEVAGRFGVTIVGGDTTGSERDLFLSITVIGVVEKELLTTRAGARVGDSIYVTGRLGGAHAGMKILTGGGKTGEGVSDDLIDKHLRPLPRLSEARYLRTHFFISSMIDVSDGLASEVNHICKNSSVGAEIFEKDIPLAYGIEEFAVQHGEKPIPYALNGGEDFELLFTARAEEVDNAKGDFENRFGIALTRVGDVVRRSKGIQLIQSGGARSALTPQGWDHFSCH